MVQSSVPRRRKMVMGLAAKRAFALFAMALMLTSLVPQSALAQTPPETPQTPADIAVLHIRIEERVASDYNESGRVNTTATGRIIVNNTGNRTLTDVVLELSNTNATSLPITNTIPVGELPPGETVVATYNFTTAPRLALSHDWRGLTYAEEVERWFRDGEIDGVGRMIYSDPRGVLNGVDNLLEFNVTVANAGMEDLPNVTLTDLLPDQTVNGSLVAVSTTLNDTDPYGGALTYDAASDSLRIPLLRNNTSTTLTLRATAPAAALGAAGSTEFDMQHEVRAEYSIVKEFTQELAAGGLTPEIQRQQEVLKLAVEMDDTQRRIQESLDVTPVTNVVTTLETEAWSLPAKLRQEAFARAKALGIPTNNSTFADELENQTRERTKEVLGRMPFLMEQFRKEHEAKVEDYVKIAGSIHNGGLLIQALFDEVGLEINESIRRESFEQIVTLGYNKQTKDLLRARGLNDSQIENMRNFTARNLDSIPDLNLTQTHDKLRDAYVQAINDSADASVLVLENSQFFNREANLTGPLAPERLERITARRNQTEVAIAAQNWTAVESSAKELAAASFDAALESGAKAYTKRYRNATVAWAAAKVALSGDNGTAASMVESLELASHIDGEILPSPVDGLGFSIPDLTKFAGDVGISTRYFATEAPPAGGFTGTLTSVVSGPVGQPAFTTSRVTCGSIDIFFSGNYGRLCTVPRSFFFAPGEFRVNVEWASKDRSGRDESGFLAGTFYVDVPGAPPPPGPTPPPTPPGGARTINVQVTVVDPSGTPVPFAAVTVSAVSAAGTSLGFFTGTAGSNGVFPANVSFQSPNVKLLVTCEKGTTGLFPGFTEFISAAPGPRPLTCQLTQFGPQVTFGTVSGRVTNLNGETVPGALVTVNGAATFTSATGKYTLTVPVGTKTVRISAPGFAIFETEVTLPPDATVNAIMRREATSLASLIARQTSSVNDALIAFNAALGSGRFSAEDFLIGARCGISCLSIPSHQNIHYYLGFTARMDSLSTTDIGISASHLARDDVADALFQNDAKLAKSSTNPNSARVFLLCAYCAAAEGLVPAAEGFVSRFGALLSEYWAAVSEFIQSRTGQLAAAASAAASVAAANIYLEGQVTDIDQEGIPRDIFGKEIGIPLGGVAGVIGAAALEQSDPLLGDYIRNFYYSRLSNKPKAVIQVQISNGHLPTLQEGNPELYRQISPLEVILPDELPRLIVEGGKAAVSQTLCVELAKVAIGRTREIVGNEGFLTGIAGEVVTSLAFEKKLGAKPVMNCVGKETVAPDFSVTLPPILPDSTAEGLVLPGLKFTLQPIEVKGKKPSEFIETPRQLLLGMCDARNDLVRKAFSTGFGSVYVMASNTLFVGQFSPAPPPCPEGI